MIAGMLLVLLVTHYTATERKPNISSSLWEWLGGQALLRRTQVVPLQFHSCLGFDVWDASGVLKLVFYIRQRMASDPGLNGHTHRGNS